MARVELGESRLRTRRRQYRLRVGVLVLGALVLLLAALVGLTHLSAVRASTITVSGAQTVASSTIQNEVREALQGNYFFVVPKDSIFLYPKAQITAQLINEYPVLASVDVHAADFHTVAVNVVERRPRALWCVGECYFMDENGVVYAPAPTFSEPVYTTYFGSTTGGALPKQFLNTTDFTALSALVDAILQKIPTEQLVGVSVDQTDVTMQFKNSFSLRFALHDQGGDVFERFSLALTSETVKAHTLSSFEYLDLRFGDKLYYKLK